jgi:hypothetical protein
MRLSFWRAGVRLFDSAGATLQPEDRLPQFVQRRNIAPGSHHGL